MTAAADLDLDRWLKRTGLADADETPRVTPLAGGVSSHVCRVDLRRGPICVKRALPQLQVELEWQVPVIRSNYEVAWFREVRRLGRPVVPEVLAHDPEASRFAMTWFEPDRHRAWKSVLVDGQISLSFASRVGEALAHVHHCTARSARLAEAFATDELFKSLRIEPYLQHTAKVHLDLAPVLERIAANTLAHKVALVHGDVSPKNILVGPDGPVFLDSECAWYGDPAFDLAFCSTHLLLKAVWLPAHASVFVEAYRALADSYLRRVSWEGRAALDARAGALLAALLLARVDGKSPVDYLDEPCRALVRASARELLQAAHCSLSTTGKGWLSLLESQAKEAARQ